MSESSITSIVPPITVAQFRQNVPAFADSSVYQDEVVQLWLQFATALLNPRRWGNILPLGLSWFVAHQLALERQAQLVANRGGIPGIGFGLIQSKSINGVSVSYNLNLSEMKDGADYNLTIYGIRFLNFARMAGSGGVQIIGADACLGAGNLFTSFNSVYPYF